MRRSLSNLRAQLILRAANSPPARFELAGAPNVATTDDHHAAHTEARIRALLGDGDSRHIRVNLRETETPDRPLPNLSAEMTEMHRSMMRGEMAAVEMTLSIALTGGQWLKVGTRFEKMQVMAEATLNFAEDLTSAEEQETLEIGAFLETLSRDMVEPVEIARGDPVRLRVRPVAFRRAIRNLVENSLRFGGGATIGWHLEGRDLVIRVLDRARASRPECSNRSSTRSFAWKSPALSRQEDTDWGGLSIARSIVRAHGGEIFLENRQEGGLAARVQVPVANPSLGGKSTEEKEFQNATHSADGTIGRDGTNGRPRGSGRRLAGKV